MRESAFEPRTSAFRVYTYDQAASTLSDSFLWIKPVLSLGNYEEDLISDSLKVL